MAERELAVVLRDVDLGTWRPSRPDPAPTKEVDPAFHEFASDWYATKEMEVEPNTANRYRHDLVNHLLPFFKGHQLSEITVAEVDRYRQHKVREAAEITAAAESGTPMMVSYVDRRGRSYRRPARPLSPRSINITGRRLRSRKLRTSRAFLISGVHVWLFAGGFGLGGGGDHGLGVRWPRRRGVRWGAGLSRGARS